MNPCERIDLASAGGVVLDLVGVIVANRQYLSEVDAAIGDGDHGINMAKGFAQCRAELASQPALPGFSESFQTLTTVLMDGIGGSMGPLYGSFFMALAEQTEGLQTLDAAGFGVALSEATAAVAEIGAAQVGDKTLMDTLVPARDAYLAAQAAGRPFGACLDAMIAAAAAGRDSTRALQARVGRAARLGERSIGVLDAGATSCFLILQSIGRSLQARLAAG